MVKPPNGGFKMDSLLQYPKSLGQNIKNLFRKRVKEWDERVLVLIILATIGIILGFSPIFNTGTQKAEADLILENLENLVITQENSLLPISSPFNPEPQATRKIRVVITAYSSSPWETDGNPYLTAAGTWVREGIIANNMLPFGTKVRIPEIYGDKIFVVEDRMNWKKGYYHIDVWFPSYWEAKNFGAKRTYIEILES